MDRQTDKYDYKYNLSIHISGYIDICRDIYIKYLYIYIYLYIIYTSSYRYIETERGIYFKELSHMILGARKSEDHGAGWEFR